MLKKQVEDEESEESNLFLKVADSRETHPPTHNQATIDMRCFTVLGYS